MGGRADHEGDVLRLPGMCRGETRHVPDPAAAVGPEGCAEQDRDRIELENLLASGRRGGVSLITPDQEPTPPRSPVFGPRKKLHEIVPAVTKLPSVATS